jgi:hypothetical protein
VKGGEGRGEKGRRGEFSKVQVYIYIYLVYGLVPQNLFICLIKKSIPVLFRKVGA